MLLYSYNQNSCISVTIHNYTCSYDLLSQWPQLSPKNTNLSSCFTLYAVATVTRLRAERPGVRIPAKARRFSLIQNVQTDCGAHLPSYSLGTGLLFWGLKRLRREFDFSRPFSAEVKNDWIYTSTTIYAFMSRRGTSYIHRPHIWSDSRPCSQQPNTWPITSHPISTSILILSSHLHVRLSFRFSYQHSAAFLRSRNVASERWPQHQTFTSV
jgi:hypothetical protein